MRTQPETRTVRSEMQQVDIERLPDIVTLDVEVTRTDIREGCPKSATNCPIARAIERTLDSYPQLAPLNPKVGGEGGTILLETITNKVVYVGIMPTKARRFIINFDQKYFSAVRPFTMRLRFTKA